MTDNRSVPPWARPVLEALRGLAYASTAASWNRVGAACTVALASDAGTPEGERVEGWTGKPCPCPNCGAIRNERDAHFCSSTRAASAPLAESGAAPDAELDRLLSAYYRAMVAFGATPGTVQGEAMADARAAIHAYVERRVREARGEVVGTAELYDSHVGHLQETHPYPRDAMIPVDLVRREKEEG